MENSVVIRIPSNEKYFSLIEYSIKKIAMDLGFEEERIIELKEAVYELLDNVLKHAYKFQKGIIEVDITEFASGIRVDVRDWGEPMASIKTRAVPINLKEDRGFNRIYKLVDQFEFFNLGKEGKKFSVIKFLSKKGEKIESLKESESKIEFPEQVEIKIRRFKKGDEEAIAKLIYRNYGYTYL